MGLDQYIYRIEKLTEDDKKRIDQGETTGFSVVELNFPEDEELVEYIKDFIYIKDKVIAYYSHDKIRKYFNIPDTATFIFSRSDSTSVVWFFKDKIADKEYKVEPSKVQNKSEVTDTKTVKEVFLKEQEIGYWRKDYKLQDKMHYACDHPVRNCGYYPLNKEMIKILLKDRTNIFARDDLTSTDNVAVCYLEWY